MVRGPAALVYKDQMFLAIEEHAPHVRYHKPQANRSTVAGRRGAQRVCRWVPLREVPIQVQAPSLRRWAICPRELQLQYLPKEGDDKRVSPG